MPSRRPPRRRLAAGVIGAAIGASLLVSPVRADAPPPPLGGEQTWPNLSDAYVEGVREALRSGTDLWGEHLIAKPEGPTFDNIKDYLVPVATGGVATGAPDTGANGISDTGYHYLPLTLPPGDTAETQSPAEPTANHYALHTADGSGITADWHTPCEAAPWTKDYSEAYKARCGNFWQAQFFVGPDGGERYGSDLGRLAGHRLHEGYLPILRTDYRDAAGVAYTQESFAARVRETGSLVSFVKITATGTASARATRLRVHVRDPKNPSLTLDGSKVGTDDAVYLLADGRPALAGTDLTYDLDLSKGPRSVTLAVLNNPAEVRGNGASVLSPGRYRAAREEVARYWRGKLAGGARISIPEEYATHALRNLLIQNLTMGWRYSIGNFYEQQYVPEMVDTVATLGEFGFTEDYRRNLQTLLELTKEGGPAYPVMYRNWEQGAKLLATARYFRLTGDREFVTRNLDRLRGYLDDYVRQAAADPNGILEKQRCCEDNWNAGYWTHAQIVSWWGWRDMVEVFRRLGRDDLVSAYAGPYETFTAKLRAAVDASATELPDGSLFVPRQLLNGDRPYQSITESRDSSYWNLLAYYGFASGFFTEEENAKLLKYVHTRGGTFLGMIRFNYTGQAIGDCNPNGLAGYEGTGVDQVYGYQYARFLAANDQADRQVLSFYGQLAHGFTRGTFTIGEGANLDPCPGKFHRGTWLSPLSANNASYLKNLREMLVHEEGDELGRPTGLRLASATPRGWLADGERVAVSGLPTVYGEVSYTLTSRLSRGAVTADVRLPSAARDAAVKLRLRVPAGHTLAGAEADGRPLPVSGDTIDLSGRHGHTVVTARFTR
ncbi:hypothetical protein HNP84_003280 [Thermocatellispora tengchongensis]|uniref:Uncharacterized protein n=1 Tax=Thermocatellispora tengchongensis TaxID=1073253 RepID=A0A840NXH4_9ACTN|nr:hypothetical protein [Thermocatellispora tengchongensis]MBB5133554.1 hypothetical protein [Thermocatellispora tengchongensis]